MPYGYETHKRHWSYACFAPPKLHQPFIAKTMSERPNIRDIYLAQKLLKAITARLEINSDIL